MMPTMTLAFDRTLEWNNADAPYGRYCIPFYVRNGDSWEELQEQLTRYLPDRLILIADRSFPKAQGERVEHYLNEVAPCSVLTFNGSEETKHLVTVQMLGDAALAEGATRSSIFVALGGGLIGNVCGLLAALFCRGSRFVHMPTTLLAASDSCLSLKQGVNSSWGKNHFGAFYAPLFVWADTTFFETLPAIEIRAALNECIKNVLAICPQYCQELLSLLRLDARYTPAQYARIIDLCIEAKGSLMREDAFEKHRAVLLEYGHTAGHALELASEGRLSHGIAIGIGMVIEATLSHQLGLLSQADLQTHYELLKANGAPVAIPAGPQYSTKRLMSYLTRDNKRGYLPPFSGKIDMVLLEVLGMPAQTANTVLTQVKKEAVAAAIDACRAS